MYVRHTHAWSESCFGSGRMPCVNLTKIEDSASYTLLQGAVSALNKSSYPGFLACFASCALGQRRATRTLRSRPGPVSPVGL